jgi:hypothetical protein
MASGISTVSAEVSLPLHLKTSEISVDNFKTKVINRRKALWRDPIKKLHRNSNQNRENGQF